MIPLRLPIVSLSLLILATSSEAADWQILHSEQGARIHSQQSQQNSTALALQLPGNKAALVLGTPVGFPLVIEDLTPEIRVKSDQVGIAIGAQVVLPRTIHPDTKRPVSYIVPGTKYAGTGNWETLGFWDLGGAPNLLKESDKIAALLQSELNMSFDTR